MPIGGVARSNQKRLLGRTVSAEVTTRAAHQSIFSNIKAHLHHRRDLHHRRLEIIQLLVFYYTYRMQKA